MKYGDGEEILKLDHVSKQYPGVLALDNMSLSFRKGEIHALVGQNGAGKSTLIKICSGAIAPSAGAVTINGNEYNTLTPKKSQEEGIAVVYQELNLVRQLSVAENIYLGQKSGPHSLFRASEIEKKAQELENRLGIEIPVKEKVFNLSPGYQQLVQIMNALSHDAHVIILDEPSATLTDVEIAKLFEILKKLKQTGVTIIYISHRLDEIFEIADRVTILRDGKKIDTKGIADTSKDELISMMVGREMKEMYPVYEGHPSDEPVLEIEHLYGNGLTDISLCVHRGEVLGLGGLVGAGRTELAQMIFGVVRPTSGTIKMNGKEIRVSSPQDALKNKIALVPEDRKQDGLVLGMSIKKNISLPSIRNLSSGLVMNSKKETDIAKKYFDVLQIKAPSLQTLASSLSGGNQQKIVIAKWLAMSPELIILDEPTRGIDVAAKYEIYLLIHEMLRSHKTLIMISSEMDELIHMSDRIVVFSEGHVSGTLEKDEFSQEKILQLASRTDFEESA